LAATFPLFSPETVGHVAFGLLGLLLGLVSFIVLAISEYGAWALIVPPRVGQASTPGTADRVPEGAASSIAIVALDGCKLAGLFYPAEQNGSTGRVVILLHGFAEAPSTVRAARVASLIREGWNVAAIDLRGYGQSGGFYASFGGREAGDVRTWLDVLSMRPECADGFTPVLWGRSMGAAIALRVAAEDARVRALVLESPMVDLEDALARWFHKRRLPFGRLLSKLVTRRASKLAGVSLTRPRPLDVAPRVRCPVLILHGTDDSLVPTPKVRQLCEAFHISPHFIDVPGAGHADVVAIAGEPVLVDVLQFLREATG
jgi:pimeloyl-ACP methyl ester carboxylesterase